jgi:hypothetical protein
MDFAADLWPYHEQTLTYRELMGVLEAALQRNSHELTPEFGYEELERLVFRRGWVRETPGGFCVTVPFPQTTRYNRPEPV